MSLRVLRAITCIHFHIILPLVLLAASVVRYNALSFTYLVCLLVTPLLRTPTKTSMKGLTGIFLKCLIPVSLLPVLGHIIFHVTLVAIATDSEPYGHMFTNCSSTESLVRQIGYQRLDKASAVNIIRLVAPDAVLFIIAVITLVLSVKLANRQADIGMSLSETPLLGGVKKKSSHNFLKLLAECLQNVALLAAGVIVPSVLGGVYFIVFLIVLILWGLYKSIGPQFGYARILLLAFTGSHILLLHLYQFQFFQEVLAPSDLISRIMGLIGIVRTDCANVDSIVFYPSIRWSVFINPALLLVLYWFLALNTNLWRRRMQSLKEPAKRRSTGSGERQVFRQTSLNEWDEPKRCIDSETGSMVFSGSFIGDDEPGEDERLVEHEEPPGGHYGGVNEAAAPFGSDREVPEDHGLAEPAAASDKAEKVKRRAWMSVVVLIMRQSYVLSLIAMMAWSITYHSWLTFAFLLAACILWMLPNSRGWCLRTSPFVLAYAVLLLLAQYIFCMNLDNELPKMAGTYKLDEIGLKRFVDPCLNLALQAFYTLFLVLTMRQFWGERHLSSSNTADIKMQPRAKKESFLDKLLPLDMQHQSYDSKTMVFIGQFLWVLLCKYWIFFCTIMMAIISLQDVVIYRIIYMILFLIFLILFQVNFTLWRAINFIFWWVVILYSMFVLTLIYTYQFEEFHKYWINFTGFTDNDLKDIGLERYDTAGLFVKLLTPTSFLVFVILQLRYFHTPFLHLSAIDRYRTATDKSHVPRSDDEGNLQNITEDEDELLSDQEEQQKERRSLRNWMKRKVLALSEKWINLTLFLWRLGEIHIFKLVALIVVVVSVYEVSALTAIYVLLVAVLLPLPKANLLLSHLLLLWTTIIILAKMIFQLNLVKADYWKTSCNNSFFSNTTDNAIWFGLKKINSQGDNSAISYYLRLYILVLVVIVCESIIRYHQRQYYKTPSIVKPARGILFPNISRPDADKGILSCIKFFANYFFYKFGLECCYIMTAVVVCTRVDAVALVYIVLVAAIMMMSRRTVARLWTVYMLILAIFLAVQFLVVLGFPAGACIGYPWQHSKDVTQNLKQWLFLPDYERPPHSLVLIGDFLQLLFVSLQAYVFSIEASPERVERYGGGDNADILADVEQNKPIPCEDFTLEQTKGIDVLKYLVFENMFWVTMAIIFITGATRINIFSLIYVIAVFCFMWFGKEFYLKPLRSMLRMWNFLIGYCILVMFFKTGLQLVGCVYVKTLVSNHQCWLVQLFGVNCLLSNIVESEADSGTCRVEEDDAGLAWDVVCLTFLLLQRRVYSSHYFRHIVDTIQAQNNLVSKGAELINRIMIREVNKQNEQERNILTDIKKKMKVLKKNQAAVTKDYKEPEEHFQAIRGGDYYLFESEGVDEHDKTAVTSLTFGTDTEGHTEGPNPLQVVNTAYDQDIKTAVETYPGSTSDAQEKKEEKSEDEPESVGKIWMVLNFIATIFYSIIDWLIRLCNRLSRNYRLVAKKLEKDLIIEKKKILRTKGVSHDGAAAAAVSDQDVKLDIENIPGPSECPVDKSLSRTLSESMLSLDELEKQDEDEIAKQFKDNDQRMKRLFTAFVLLLVSRSELLCYFLMILDQMVYGSLLSLPLPLMVFLWGMLSVPRPSKTFWVTVITYTEAVVVCKYLFQFGFFPWNDGTIYDNPFFPPRIIGIEKTTYYANVDIVLLLALFLHRSILRKYGLWRDAADITADMEAAEIKEHSVPASPEMQQDEDSYFKDSETEQTPTSETAAPPSKLSQGLSYIVKPFTKFFKQVTESSYNATADVYAAMFMCDFILFLVLVLFFSSFGPAETTGDASVTNYIEDNKIPIPFLIMLITQFIFIIIDRAIFLRKFVLGKFIFQILLVILIHVWMFFVLPAITKKSFFDNVPAQIWYLIKCIYFGLSAYQIRCGYPNRILGNFLTKKYGYTNVILFKGFLAIPFLLELRALMDWIWTDSTLAIGSWLQMEDIYANVFVLKCWREIEKAYPQERAIKKSAVAKYVVGGILLVVIIFIIWFPLVFFSFFNSVFITNPPFEASMTIGITGYQPLLTTTAQGSNIAHLTDAEFSTLKQHYSKDRNANSFLSGYEKEDVTKVVFNGRSLSIWGISPVSQEDLVQELADKKSKLSLTVEMKFSREPDKSLPGEVTNIFELDFQKLIPRNKDVPMTLARMINGTYNESCTVIKVFPRFIRLAGQSKATELKQLTGGTYGMGLSNISLQLQSESSMGLSEWWNVNEIVTDPNWFEYKNPDQNRTYPNIHIITFNDRKAPASLSFLSGYGIIGLYISFILLIGRLLRLSTTNQYMTIMFRELPDVDRLLKLCLDIYLVREMKEFRMEEDLYAKLIFLYRSPETTIKFTRQTVRIGNIKRSDDKKKSD